MKRTWLRLLVFVVSALFAQACRVVDKTGTTYYVSMAGSDTNSGTPVDRAWKSIERANRQSFQTKNDDTFERRRCGKGIVRAGSNAAIFSQFPTRRKDSRWFSRS